MKENASIDSSLIRNTTFLCMPVFSVLKTVSKHAHVTKTKLLTSLIVCFYTSEILKLKISPEPDLRVKRTADHAMLLLFG